MDRILKNGRVSGNQKEEQNRFGINVSDPEVVRVCFRRSRISKIMSSSRPSFAVVKAMTKKFTNSLSEMLAADHPVLRRFNRRSLLFSTSTFLAIDPGADKDHIVWLYVDIANTKASIVIERAVWDISGGVVIWTELPDDQFDGMTIDDFVCCLKDKRWTLVCQTGPISKLSVEAKNAFESYLNDCLVSY